MPTQIGDPDRSANAEDSLSELQSALLTAKELYKDVGGVDLLRFPISAYRSLLDAYPRERSYDHLDVEVATKALLIKHQYGLRGLLCYHAALLIDLIEDNHKKLLESDYPSTVKELGIENFNRILEILIEGAAEPEHPTQHNPPLYLAYPNDQFHKDLSAATLNMLVCGGRKLGRVKYPLGLLKSHPTKMLRYIASNGYSGAYLETHFDSNDKNLRERFGKESWKLTLMTAAQLMKDDDELKGFVGHSWYYDPRLSEIAPNLHHIGGMIMENGGSVFCTGTSESTTESALRNSTVRRGLYELGLYQPKRFKILWPRKAALQWLEKQVSQA